MKKVTKKTLERWCSNYSNCYYFLINDTLYNTGWCPWIYEQIAEDISNSIEFEEVTKNANIYHPQLKYEVEHNDCKLFRITSCGGNRELIICYFGHKYE